MPYQVVTTIPKALYPQLLTLIHNAFQMHLDNGLMFSCSNYAVEDVERIVASYKVFCCLDNGVPIGITAVSVIPETNSAHKKHAYEVVSAVSPGYKRRGVGTILYNERSKYLKKIGCSYIVSNTSVRAKDSINWHVKKCNCSIIGYSSWPDTNYYSCIFREDFEHVSWLKRKVVYKLMAYYSWMRVHLLRKADGSRTGFACMLVKLMNYSV